MPSRKRTTRSTRSRKTQGRSRCGKGKKLSLISIKKSPKKDKKYVASFCKNGRIKQTHFGAKGMSDYTKHKDKQRKSRYIQRHKSRENWRDPTSAGALSRYILWGKPSFRASVSDYKRRFKL